MAKMTKAAARKRLTEAANKVQAVASSTAMHDLTSAQRTEIYGLVNRILNAAKKFK